MRLAFNSEARNSRSGLPREEAEKEVLAGAGFGCVCDFKKRCGVLFRLAAERNRPGLIAIQSDTRQSILTIKIAFWPAAAEVGRMAVGTWRRSEGSRSADKIQSSLTFAASERASIYYMSRGGRIPAGSPRMLIENTN